MKSNRREFLSNIIKTAGIAAGAGILGGTSVHAKGGRKQNNSSSGLTKGQKADLFYLYQEEKVARDVYITLGIEYPDESTFANIQLSEQRHIEAVGRLCVKYGIDISGVDLSPANVGYFELEELQNLYDASIKAGMGDGKTLIDALNVGRDIEITDILDLETFKDGMPSDVVRVMDNLLEGSRNHLAAFERAIVREEA